MPGPRLVRPMLVALCFASSVAEAVSLVGSPSVAVTSSQVTVWWQTDVSATTELHYGRSPAGSSSGYSTHSSYSALAGTLHSRTVSHLRPGRYFFRVRSVDAGAQAAESAEGTFVVPAATTEPLSRYGADHSANALVRVGPTLYVGGAFSAVWVRRGSGLVFDDATGVAEDDQPIVGGQVQVAVPDGAGGFFIGGDFTRVGALARNRIAHLLPDLGVDPLWNPSIDNTVHGLSLGNGVLYVGGRFTNVNGVARLSAAALDASTGALLSWNPSTQNIVYAVQVAGSTVYLGGTFAQAGGSSRNRLAAVDATTGAATSWNPNVGSPRVLGVALSGSTLYAVGQFSTVNGSVARNYAAAFDATTGVATSWSPSPDGPCVDVAVVGTTVYLAGQFTTVNGGISRAAMAAVDGTTGIALSWNPAGGTLVNAIEPSASGQTIYAVGPFGPLAAAIDASTGTTTSWAPRLSNLGSAVAVQGNRVYLGGAFSGAGASVPRDNLFAVDTDTDTLLPWNPGQGGGVASMVRSGSTLYIGGTFVSVGGVGRARAAALDLATGAVTSWNPNITGPAVESLAVSGTTIYLGGTFTQVGGVARANAAAVDSSGALLSWDPAPNATVNALVVDAATAYLGGTFTSAGGTTRSRVAAVDAATGVATSWNPGADDSVASLALTGTGIYLGGQFTTANGTPRSRVAGVDVTTGSILGWNPGANGNARGIASIGSRILVADSLGLLVTDGTSGALDPWSPQVTGTLHTVRADCTTGLVDVGGHLFTAGGTAQQTVATFISPFACTGNPPAIVDQQPGDTTWRNANTGTYDVRFSDPEGLASFSTRVRRNADDTEVQAWTQVSTLSGTSAATPWALLGSTWTAMAEGINLVSVRVVDTDANTRELAAAFEVAKDTVPPAPVTDLAAASPATTPALSWSPVTDATSGVAAYRVYRASPAVWALLQEVSGSTHVDVSAPPGDHSYRVQPVDRAGNEQLVGANVVTVTVQPGDGGADGGTDGGSGGETDGGADGGTDAGSGGGTDGGSGGGQVAQPTSLRVGCSCRAMDGWAPAVGVALLGLWTRRRRRRTGSSPLAAGPGDPSEAPPPKRRVPRRSRAGRSH